MSKSIALEKPSIFAGILSKIKTTILPSKGTFDVVKSVIIPIASVLLFFLVWHFGSKSLYNAIAGDRIEAAMKSGGETAAKAMESSISEGWNLMNGTYEESLRIKSNETMNKNVPSTLPPPLAVKNAFLGLWKDHKQVAKDKSDFRTRTAAVNKKLKAQGKPAITYTGRPSFVDQIKTSLKTVFAGVLLAIFIAVPIGIATGLSDKLMSAFNWIIQIFKPVSPVVWLLLVYIIVTGIMRNSTTDKAFVVSLISVGLCSMWATLVNTAMGVATVDKDYMNVANVLRLSTFSKVFKIILPSSLPLIFTGLRITVSVAWMVLIAIELLAQSPGLGTFVWEEFQNGANESNANIIVAMFVIGIIGFALDRIMLSLQKLMSFA